MVTGSVGRSKGIGLDAMTCDAKRPVGPTEPRMIRMAALALCTGFLAGCSASSIDNPASPSYLGARDLGPPSTATTTTAPRVTSGKVLSAVVFERVTGLEVDPARLIDR
jgi:hypothetical protein